MLPSQFLHESWQRCWRDLQLNPPVGVDEALLAHYQQSHRHYHQLQHLSECLQWVEICRPQMQQAAVLELALWFHDAIYWPRANDNEQQSALWAQRVLQQANAATPLIQRVTELILATQHHHAAPNDHDMALLLDIDLAILAASTSRFAEYQQQIRREYRWVPRWIYQKRRRAVLRGFLQRPRIYQSDYFFLQLETAARTNLQQSIA